MKLSRFRIKRISITLEKISISMNLVLSPTHPFFSLIFQQYNSHYATFSGLVLCNYVVYAISSCPAKFKVALVHAFHHSWLRLYGDGHIYRGCCPYQNSGLFRRSWTPEPRGRSHRTAFLPLHRVGLVHSFARRRRCLSLSGCSEKIDTNHVVPSRRLVVCVDIGNSVFVCLQDVSVPF